MKMLELHPAITRYVSVESWFDVIQPGETDLIVTNRFLVPAEITEPTGAKVLYQEEFGDGEPSDEMLMAMKKAAGDDYCRVIGIGGGTVMDLSKLLCLSYDHIDNMESLHEMMMGKRNVEKKCPVLLTPSTCGTGSEVTNVAVLALKSKNIKIGLANAGLFATEAALIPELVCTLPYRPMILSAIDALIHACESWLSPKANDLTRLFSTDAIRRILASFRALSENGRKTDPGMLENLLTASTLAGIAFGNAGCGMVHAMSYPIGGTYHLPHGESNYEVFLPVFRFYDEAEGQAEMKGLKKILAETLSCGEEEALDRLETLLEKLYHRRSLKEIGMEEENCVLFSADVWEKQQRLLNNAPFPVKTEDIITVYQQAR